jgi:hypothetical protein
LEKGDVWYDMATRLGGRRQAVNKIFRPNKTY